MSEKCPYCGGDLIWLYETGEIVCSSCGSVVGRIDDWRPTRSDENEEIWREIRTREKPKFNPIARKYRRDYKLYREAESYLRNKPWLEIDYQKYFATGRMINTIKSRASIEAENKISDKKLWSVIEYGLKYVESVNPAALARSARGKYALAYMVARYLENKSFPHLNEVTELFNISETSYRRLLKIAKEVVLVKETIPSPH